LVAGNARLLWAIGRKSDAPTPADGEEEWGYPSGVEGYVEDEEEVERSTTETRLEGPVIADERTVRCGWSVEWENAMPYRGTGSIRCASCRTTAEVLTRGVILKHRR
jgi:hypothetical protein